MSKNHVFINEYNVVECQTNGDQTATSVVVMGDQISALLQELKSQQKPQLLLDNIINLGNVTPDGRQAVISLAKSLAYDRAAMLGKPGIIRFSANLIIRASGRGKKLKYFSDREEAILWLLEYKAT